MPPQRLTSLGGRATRPSRSAFSRRTFANPGGKTRREYYRHIGDFALFWTGLYPEALDRQRRRACKDAVVSYTAQGKRGYLITSRLEEQEHHDAEADLFRRLSEQFEPCAVGLRKVRDEWEEFTPSAPPGGDLIQ